MGSMFLRGLFRAGKFSFAVTGISLVCSVAIAAERNRRESPFPISARRLAIVSKAADVFEEEPGFEGLSEAEVYDQVATKVIRAGIDCKLMPTGTLVTMDDCKREARERAEKEVEELLPQPSLEEIAEEAREKYPMIEKGAEVKAVFMPNPARRINVVGRYDGFDGQNLVINRKRYQKDSIKIIEPASEDAMSLIDPQLNADKRREYERQRQLDYQYERSQAMDTRLRKYRKEEVAKAIQENERNGFIFAGRKWHTLKEAIYDEMIDRRRAWIEEQERARLEAERKAREEAERLAREKAEGQEPGEIPPNEMRFDEFGNPIPPPPPPEGNPATGEPPAAPGFVPPGPPPSEPPGDHAAPKQNEPVFRPAVPKE